MLDSLSDVQTEIDDLSISVITINTSEKLIISDMPIIITNPFTPQSVALNGVGVLIFLPISPKNLIVMFDSKIYDIKKTVSVETEEDVIALNKYQMLNAENMIMSEPKIDLEKCVKAENILLDRQKQLAKLKVNTFTIENETVYASRLNNLGYPYNISFIKFNSFAKKIPSISRESCNRAYRYEERIKLLVHAYRMPDILNDNSLSSIDFKKLKKGNKQMQHFMDDYWEVLKKDRIITPELMQKLKTVPINQRKLNR